MVIQYDESIFNEIFLDVNPDLNENPDNQELVSILNNINFKNSLKIIEESIPKESFLGNYKNKNLGKDMVEIEKNHKIILEKGKLHFLIKIMELLIKSKKI